MHSVIKGQTILRGYSVVEGNLIRVACFGSLLELAHLFRPAKTTSIT